MNPGDVVYLRSGGPAMTVRHVGVGQQTEVSPLVEYAEVTWFSGGWFSGKELFTKQFPVISLTKTKPKV